MRKLYLFLILPLLLCCGCTQYNGFLGPLFGSWTMTEMLADGKRVAQTDGETVMSFQSEIIQVVRLVDDPYYVETRFGNFEHSGDVLTLKFGMRPGPDETHMYAAPTWLAFPQDGLPFHLEILELTGSRMRLSMKSDDGIVYTYRFKKTW